jgi:Lon protease-like protein
MTALERVAHAAPALKVFPLPSVVLFPGMSLPLHIFEPRYREMVRDCLATDRVIAMAQLAPGWEPQYSGKPEVLPMCCAGMTIWDQRLSDGRYHILVQGIVRVRLIEELPFRNLYREFQTEILADASFRGPEEEMLRKALFELAGRLPTGLGEALLQAAARASGGGLADAVSAALVTDTDRRHRLLAELDVRQRFRAILEDVGELIARLTPTRPGGRLN